MLIGREITIEIGGRTLLRDGTVMVGPKDKVGLVGANGAGKSSLLAFLLGQGGGHLHARGDVQATGTVGFLPQVPVPDGLGVDSTVTVASPSRSIVWSRLIASFPSASRCSRTGIFGIGNGFED